MDHLSPVHPGEILAEEFMQPLSISQHQLAERTGLPAAHIDEIVHGRRSLTADSALKLARAFSLSDGYFVNLQARYDSDTAADERA
ncbi:MAG TPA: HigA family addiction module antitoxin [Mycobacterium sp.]|nr:HigA family addiction module antitoxin [Mycobacterium sp.]